jgi:two-component system CheB/CheR fusion protein
MHQALYHFGPTDLFLKVPSGAASLDLLASAREGLRPAIRAALDEVRQAQDEPIAVVGRVKRDNRFVAVTVRAQAVQNDGEDMVLLSFVEVPKHEQTSTSVIEPPADASRLAQVEQELDATRRELSDAVRDRETAEEEIRAVHEEAMSVNEEFQTTNEELETSKEELQSLNEELTALNSQLQETLNRYQTLADDLENILNSADVATLFLDRGLRIRFFTPAARMLFSVIGTDIGRPLADLAHHFADGSLLSDVRIVLGNLVPLAREVTTQNGSWYTCRILPYRTKDNRIEGVVITFVDVTARKQAEDALGDAKQHAESANLGKSRFLAAASHDLRQPLQTLTLLQSLLAKRLSGKAELELVARSEEALTAMAGMLGALLDINQLEAGVTRPEPVDFPISDLLDRLRSEFAYHAHARGLDWRVRPSRLVVRSDTRLLEQMIRNLLSNAVKYTKKGGVLLGCRRRGDKLRIEIWDTGLGIPQGQLRMIFQEFHQIDNPARDQRRGLGLGLAIVQRLGDLLGHAVDVRSKHGRGSVFSIEVGLAPAVAPAVTKSLAPEPKQVAARSGSLLVVEDDPDLRYSLETLLRADGHRITACADGDEAIRLVRRKEVNPDLVIVDNNLPGELTGVQLMARLHGMLGHDVPALVLSGDISTKTLTEIAAHNYVHRSKPISAEELTHLVQVLLAERHPARAPAGAPLQPVGGDATPPASVWVVDDDGAVRDALRDLIEHAGHPVKTYASAREFLDATDAKSNGCLVVDCRMPEMDGIALLEHLKAQGYRIATIMITGFGEVPLAVRAMKAGAAAFIEKPVNGAELLAAIDSALRRARRSDERASLSEEGAARVATLTPREREVMDLVTQGKPNKEIAFLLGISQRTIENHRAVVMRKIGARSLSDLIRLTLEPEQ